MADRYLLESGSPDGYLLEDSSGVLLLEAGTVQWSTSDQNAGVALSNSNLTATLSSTISSVRANVGGTGKFYFEVSVDAVGSTFGVGVADATGSLAAWSGDSGNTHGALQRNDTTQYSGGSSGVGFAYTTADIIGIAVDEPNKLVWWAKNNVWQLSGNPATGTNGVSISTASGAIYPIFQGAFSTEVATGRFTAASQTYSPPSGFTALDAGSGALTGTSSLTFSPSGALTGTGALTAASTLTFAPSSTIQGLAPITGASLITFSPSSTLTGRGALSGTSSLTFAPSGTATGTGALTGTSTLVFSPSGTLTGPGALTGASTLAFTPTATLTGKGALSGASALTFAPSGTITGSGALSGTSSISFAPLGTLTNGGAVIGSLTGSSSISFSPAATLSGTGALVGSTDITFAPAGTLGGTAYITGISSLTFTAAATLHGEGPFNFWRQPPLIGRRTSPGRNR